MKTKITSVCLFLMLVLGATTSKASNLYVVSGESFTITPGTGFVKYLWDRDNQTILDEDILPGGVLTKSLLNAGTTITKHTLKLSVLEQLLGGCYSEAVSHTIIVLPKLTTLIAANLDNFCSEAVSISSELTSSFVAGSLLTNLAEYGVGFTYQWAKKTGQTLTDIPQATSDKLIVTEVGEYVTQVAYSLPADGLYKTNGSSLKVPTAIASSAQEIKKTLAKPLSPDILIQ